MNKNLPLSDIIILDLTNVLSGPFATQILLDLGAEIIKVEKPGGDDSRKFGPFIKKRSSYFISLNRGKKSISHTVTARSRSTSLLYRAAFLNVTASLAARQNTHVTSLCSRFPVHRRRTSDPSSSQQQHSSWVATWLKYLMCTRVHLDNAQPMYDGMD